MSRTRLVVLVTLLVADRGASVALSLADAHAREGRTVLMSTAFPARRGYPAGLSAAQLPLETRILAVCDVYDALVSDRVYRAAWSPERAFRRPRDEAHAYDQAVVEALARVVGEPAFVAGVQPSGIARPLTKPSDAAISPSTPAGTA